jgi:hypothetical protein
VHAVADGLLERCCSQDCNYRVFDGAGNVDFVTANTNRGAAPCRLQVTNAGTLQIVDASPYNVVWNTNNVPTAPALTSGILGQGQLLTQVTTHVAHCQ